MTNAESDTFDQRVKAIQGDWGEKSSDRILRCPKCGCPAETEISAMGRIVIGPGVECVNRKCGHAVFGGATVRECVAKWNTLARAGRNKIVPLVFKT